MYIALAILILYVSTCMLFYLIQEKMLFHPVKTHQEHIYKFNDTHEEKYYKTPNDGNIHSIKFKSENSKGIVFYLHGNAGNLEDWAWLYPTFLKRNYDFEIIDYRNFGKSTGVLSEEYMHNDVQYIYDKLKEEYVEKNIIIYGRSIGTGLATKLSSINNPKILILESPYFNIKDIASKIVPFLPLDLLLKYQFKNNENIQNVDVPIYILHGKLDKIVPFASGEKLYKSAQQKVNFIVFDEATHSDIASFERYRKLMDEILD